MCDNCLNRTHTQSTSKAIQRHQITASSQQPRKVLTDNTDFCLLHLTLFFQNLMCEVHDEPLKYYCTQDKVLVCRDCLTLPKCTHKDHAYVTIKEASTDSRKEIDALLKQADERKQEFLKLLEDVKDALKEVEKNDQTTDALLTAYISQLVTLKPENKN